MKPPEPPPIVLPPRMPAAVEYRQGTPTWTPPTKERTGPCGKCDGKGYVDWARHVANGVCFWCQGTRQIRIKARPGYWSYPGRGLYLTMMGRIYYVERIWDNSAWLIYGREEGCGGSIYAEDNGEITLTNGPYYAVAKQNHERLRRIVRNALEIRNNPGEPNHD